MISRINMSKDRNAVIKSKTSPDEPHSSLRAVGNGYALNVDKNG